MSPNILAPVTPPAWNLPDTTGVTPAPTPVAIYQGHKGLLLRRDVSAGRDTCGWINGDPSKPFTCSANHTCVADTQYTAFGCCNSVGNCDFYTHCSQGFAGTCYSSAPGDCFHYQYSLACRGDWGCITYVMPDGVSSLDCGNPVGNIVSVQTNYAGGPANQTVPMPYDHYLIAATSTLCSLSSITSGCPTPTSTPSQALVWVDHHESLIIGLAVAVAILLLLGCCVRCFWPRRRKNRNETSPEEVIAMPIQYTYVVPPKQNS